MCRVMHSYHVGSSKEGVICELALSHRGISDRTGWWSGTRCTWNTDIRICGPCVCTAPVPEPIKTWYEVTTTLDLDHEVHTPSKDLVDVAIQWCLWCSDWVGCVFHSSVLLVSFLGGGGGRRGSDFLFCKLWLDLWIPLHQMTPNPSQCTPQHSVVQPWPLS